MARPRRGGPGATGPPSDHRPRLPAPAARAQTKALHASERHTERVQTLRATCREPVQAFDVPRLKVIAASGVTRAMSRRYGRAPPGQRVVEHVPDHEGPHPTSSAALGLDGLAAPWVVDGAIHGEILPCWVSAVVGPPWQPGDIGLWEKRSAHQVAGVAERLATRGARLLRWSPYAPDCNPMEQCWSKSNTCGRRAQARTVEALIEALKEVLDTVTQTDSRGWFVHCG